MGNGTESATLGSSATTLNSIIGEPSLGGDANEPSASGCIEINGVMVDPASLYGPPIASKVWGFSLATLASRRCRGLDPFFKRGRTIQYLGADLIASWKDARVEPGDEPRSSEAQRNAATTNIKRAHAAKKKKAAEREVAKAKSADPAPA